MQYIQTPSYTNLLIFSPVSCYVSMCFLLTPQPARYLVPVVYEPPEDLSLHRVEGFQEGDHHSATPCVLWVLHIPILLLHAGIHDQKNVWCLDT